MVNWQEQSRFDTSVTDDDRRRTLRVDHASKLTRLERSIAGRSIVGSEQAGGSCDHLPDTFDVLPVSSTCVNLASTPSLEDFGGNMDFGNYLPDDFEDPFNMAESSATGDLDASYPMLDNNYGYGIYMGGQGMLMPYNEIFDEFGNPVDTQDVWG